MEEVFFSDERNQKWWGRKTLRTAGAKCPSSMRCACLGWRNMKDGTVLEAGKMAGQFIHFTQTDKWSHGHSPWSSLSWNLDGWFSHQMLPFCHLPEAPFPFISFHPGKLCRLHIYRGTVKSWNWFHKPQMKITVMVSESSLYHNNLTVVHITVSSIHQVQSPIKYHSTKWSSFLQSPRRKNWRCLKRSLKSSNSYKMISQLLQSKDPVSLNGTTSIGNIAN